MGRNSQRDFVAHKFLRFELAGIFIFCQRQIKKKFRMPDET
jgi:hypothetical protein